LEDKLWEERIKEKSRAEVFKVNPELS